jgi:hypothetical protein
MSATGLPVVSSLMKPLLGMATGLVVTSTESEYVAAFASTSRATLSPLQAAELAAVSAANDYDEKFRHAVEALDERAREPQPTTRVDRLIAALGPSWSTDQVRFSRWLAMPLFERILGWLITTAARLIPSPLKRRLVSRRLRAAARELRGS